MTKSTQIVLAAACLMVVACSYVAPRATQAQNTAELVEQTRRVADSLERLERILLGSIYEKP